MSGKSIDVSVIVPIYNVEEYLEECLESLVNQTKENIEIIMVDDGSTDSSAEIAKKYEEEYGNFHLYQKENGGLGMARNYGIQRAKGKYIAFIDSDDMVSKNIYELMYNLAEKNNSDLTACNVIRFKSNQTKSVSKIHERIFGKNIKQNTHITETPILIYDTISCNKLILKSFWDKNNFKFPEGVLYEDIPVIIPMQYLANNISIVKEVGYYWRIRDGVSKSITQNTGDLKNLFDRLTVLSMVYDFFRKNNFTEAQKEPMYLKTLEIDLMIFVNECRLVAADIAKEIMRELRNYINENINIDILKKLSIVEQQKYQYIFDDDLEKLIDVLNYQWPHYYEAPVIEGENGEFTTILPDELFSVETRDVTEELKKRDFKKAIDNIKIKNKNITVTGNVFLPRVNIKSCGEQPICIYLYNTETEDKKKLEVEEYITPEFNKKYGYFFDKETGEQCQYNYDGTGFKFNINLNEIDIETLDEGNYKILIEYKNRVSSGELFLSGTKRDVKNFVNYETFIKNDTIARVRFSPTGELQLAVTRENVFAKKIDFDEQAIICELEKPIKAVFAKSEEKEEEIPFSTEDDLKFVLDIKNLEKSKAYKIIAVDENDRTFHVISRARKFTIRSKEEFFGFITPSKAHHTRITINKSGTKLRGRRTRRNLTLAITSTIGNSEEILKAKKAELCVNNKFTGEMEPIAKAKMIRVKDGKLICYFAINFASEKVKKNLYAGHKDIFIVYTIGDKQETHKVYRNKYFKDTFSSKTLDIEYYRGRDGVLRLYCIQKWPEKENTFYKRKNLMFENYPKYRKKPINKKRIVFSSMWGGKYSCNPQHLYEYIDKNYPDYECIWVFKDLHMPISGHGKRVRQDSLKYHYYMATAKYLVNNVNFNEDYVKRDGQIEIQTMHGTPLKKIGLDVSDDFPTETSKQKYIEKNSRWNYLIAQGEFIKDKVYSIYRFDKEVLETGYPRTDHLFKVSEDDINRIKKSLGLPMDKKIILYAPTWRTKKKFEMKMDLEKMKEDLSDEYILLTRIHHLCGGIYDFKPDDEFIYDLTSYRTIEDLYIIADVLITDYSSVMFDYALLNKPMIFFTYDLEDYRENLRGLYFDIEEEAPGPLVFNTDELIESLKNIDKHGEKYKEKIDSFKKKYLTYENGESSAKVFEKVMKPKPSLKRSIIKLGRKMRGEKYK